MPGRDMISPDNETGIVASSSSDNAASAHAVTTRARSVVGKALTV